MNTDTAPFWTKVELPDGKLGFLRSSLQLDDTNKLTMRCPKRTDGGLWPGWLNESKLPQGSVAAFAFQDASGFELWSGEVAARVASTDDADEYLIEGLNLEMETSERARERYLVSVPILLKNCKFTWRFGGAELSEGGVGLWLPHKCSKKIIVGQTYEVCFKPREVEPFSFKVECVRPHSVDNFSHGTASGFKLLDVDPQELRALRLRQLIAARGKLRNPHASMMGHYLQTFWQGEVTL